MGGGATRCPSVTGAVGGGGERVRAPCSPLDPSSSAGSAPPRAMAGRDRSPATPAAPGPLGHIRTLVVGRGSGGDGGGGHGGGGGERVVAGTCSPLGCCSSAGSAPPRAMAGRDRSPAMPAAPGPPWSYPHSRGGPREWRRRRRRTWWWWWGEGGGGDAKESARREGVWGDG
jgi:hypothetical protein